MKIKIILAQQTPKVQPIKDIRLYLLDNIELFSNFIKFANTQNMAVGLAANQVSIDGKRCEGNFFGIKESGNWRLVFNPIINEYIGIKETKVESCLTWPNKIIVVERYRAIKVSYYNLDGTFIENELHFGFDAQIWQHEINHLMGIPERIEELNYIIPKKIKVGRNDKCPCGSGKKYKFCCLNYR